MGWFSRKKTEAPAEKLNPAQALIRLQEPANPMFAPTSDDYKTYYETLEVVNRGVNMIVDDVADIPVTVGDKLAGVAPLCGTRIRRNTLQTMLNFAPNPFQDTNSFKRNMVMDYLLEGMIVLYFDGGALYQLPAKQVTIHADKKNYIEKYVYGGQIEYTPDEIILIKDNSAASIYRGTSRLQPARNSLKTLTKMRGFQGNFFDNGTVPGLVLKTPNTLSDKIKERIIESWQDKYNPATGGRRPLILDSGMELDKISNSSFKDLDFVTGVDSLETKILKALGIPPVLLDGGNNANIKPNHRLYFLETVIPIVRKINHAISRFFAYEIWEDTTDVSALLPELSEQASFFTQLVNGGIFTANEARVALGKVPLEGNDEIRIPQNIAGSAVDPSVGGRPNGAESND